MFEPKDCKRYVCKQDYRHYKKGDEVLLRDAVAESLVKDGVVEAKKAEQNGKPKSDDKK